MSAPGQAVWLYGSHARGQADPLSDQDVLVISDVDTEFECLQSNCSITLNRTSLSRYTWKEIKGMAAYGSLFLQHLRLEAVPLYESTGSEGFLRSILDNLGDYALANRDVRGFEVVLDDIEESVAENDQDRYELAVLGTVIRHCSILGCWLLKKPSFARVEPVARLVSRCGLKEEIADEFDDLYCHRLYIDGRVGPAALRSIPAMAWLSRAREVVQTVKEMAHARP